jgi:HAD superfamily hydrolase (TIGR01548 family)
MNGRTLLVFDMDGVLIDVSRSYRETVRRTARLFFKPAAGWHELPDPLFPLTDLAELKMLGNLNNDWDLSFTVIRLLCSLVENSELRDGADVWQRHTRSLSLWNVEPLARFLRSTGKPLSSLLLKAGPPAGGDPLRVFFAGEAGRGNLIKQLFQELYLGAGLFRRIYGSAPRVHSGAGLIREEALLPEAGTLRALAAGNDLAVATGRPRLEAQYGLERFGIAPLFEAVLTLDDCLAEEKRVFEEQGRATRLVKPHPYMLEAIARRRPYERRYYVGDMPDDMVAAVNASFTAVGLASSAADAAMHRAALRQSGAELLIERLEELDSILSGTA